jgi:hypothetical protein
VALKRLPSRLNGKPSRNFAHGREQWQSTSLVRHGLVGDGRTARFEQAASLVWIWRQMKVREEYLPGVQLGPLHRLRLFHLYDHLGHREDTL